MTNKPIIHGRDHRPGGADPIPGVPSNDSFAQWHRIPLIEFSQSPFGNLGAHTGSDWSTWTFDSACYYGGYLLGTADQAECEFRLKLGPQYSTWLVVMSGVTGSDGGILTVDFGTTTEDSGNNVLFPGYWNEPRGLMSDNPLGTGSGSNPVNYVRPSTSGGIDFSINAYDFYSSGTAKNQFPSLGALFRITGEDGAEFTSITTSGPLSEFTGMSVWDGGAGLYSCRLKIDGKNASSSAYKVKLSTLLIARVSGQQDL